MRGPKKCGGYAPAKNASDKTPYKLITSAKKKSDKRPTNSKPAWPRIGPEKYED